MLLQLCLPEPGWIHLSVFVTRRLYHDFLQEGKTYFIMKDGSALPYYKTVLDIIPKIYVYNRNSLKGVECLNLREVKSVIVEDTEDYEERAKKFLTFINKDLKDRSDLREAFKRIWNGEELFDLMHRDKDIFPELFGEEFDEYLTELKSRYDDVDFLSYFYEKYCLQEFFFPRYSEDWLKVFDGPDDDIKFVNPDDLDDITLGE